MTRVIQVVRMNSTWNVIVSQRSSQRDRETMKVVYQTRGTVKEVSLLGRDRDQI